MIDGFGVEADPVISRGWFHRVPLAPSPSASLSCRGGHASQKKEDFSQVLATRRSPLINSTVIPIVRRKKLFRVPMLLAVLPRSFPRTINAIRNEFPVDEGLT